jgi:hypothetical protein
VTVGATGESPFRFRQAREPPHARHSCRNPGTARFREQPSGLRIKSGVTDSRCPASRAGLPEIASMPVPHKMLDPKNFPATSSSPCGGALDRRLAEDFRPVSGEVINLAETVQR